VTTTRTFTRRCSDCGDVSQLRYDGHHPVGSLVIRRCRQCAPNAITHRSGYFTPRDDIDDVMVDRLMGGRDRGSNIAERLEATARLVGVYRLPAPLVAERLGVTTRTVERYKRELRAADRLAA